MFPKEAIKGVEFPKLFEGGSGNERINIAGESEGEAVRGKPVVIMMLHAVQGEGFGIHDQTAGFQEIELFLIGLCRLVHGGFPPGIERQP